ncbi:MAG: GntR family transcriptional regulator [Sphaerochaetaceae bacterium]|nr:GntR family transcriptional regulator [Sphaerochaetaceae bacterium]MDC7237577.1 GntR family transcriptional regulator [Sphaerochaetaceae bacterium]MDC7249215.1 GntR family transcriptional regulator [Sphaerochaetaceae bacterium]
MPKKFKKDIIYDYIKVFIEQNKYNSINKIPSEPYLCSRFNASRETVRRALDMLKEENIIFSVKGSGTYFKPVAIQDNIINNNCRYRIATIIQGQDKLANKLFIKGLQQELKDKSIELRIFYTDNKFSNERACLKACTKGFDGLIIDGVKASLMNPNLDIYQKIEQKDIRVIFYNNYYPETNFPKVIIDDKKCANLLVKQIVEEGHKDIAGIFFYDNYQGIQKYRGFIQALNQYNIEIKDENIKWIISDNIADEREFDRIISKFLKKNRSSAIICCNFMILKHIQYKTKYPRKLACFDYSGDNWKEENILCSISPSFEVGIKVGKNIIRMLDDSNYKIHDYSYIFKPTIYYP